MTHAEMVEEVIKLHEWVKHWSQRAEAAETELADAKSRLAHTQAGLTIWMERSKSNARELDEAYDAMCDIAKTLDCAEDWAAIKGKLAEAAEDTADLDWLENFGAIKYSTTTREGKPERHIESCYGSSMQAHGPTLRAAIRAARGK